MVRDKLKFEKMGYTRINKNNKKIGEKTAPKNFSWAFFKEPGFPSQSFKAFLTLILICVLPFKLDKSLSLTKYLIVNTGCSDYQVFFIFI